MVVPAYNSSESIGHCLKSLASQDYPQNRNEIIVIHSGVDDTGLVCSQFKVHYYHSPTRLSAGRARNTGAALARGEIVAFIDADCVAAEDWLGRITKDFCEFPYVYGILGRYQGGKSQLDRVRGWELLPDRKLPGFFPGFIEGNAAFKRQIFERGCQFGDMTYGECIKFARWLKANNCIVLQDTTLKVIHSGHITFRKSFEVDRQYWRLTFRQETKPLLLGLLKLSLTVASVLGSFMSPLLGLFSGLLIVSIAFWYSLAEASLSVRERLRCLPILIPMKLVRWAACVVESPVYLLDQGSMRLRKRIEEK